MDDGVIKFRCNWIKSDEISYAEIAELNHWRKLMHRKKWIGEYPDGIGYGNISQRDDFHSFLVSGTATGGMPNLDETHYSKVIEYSIENNSLTCKGLIKASSESLTHAMIYSVSKETNAVIHIHDDLAWKQLMFKVPTTAEHVDYGSPEMAIEIRHLFSTSGLPENKILVMGGHRGGIISFGKDLEEAAGILLATV